MSEVIMSEVIMSEVKMSEVKTSEVIMSEVLPVFAYEHHLLCYHQASFRSIVMMMKISI